MNNDCLLFFNHLNHQHVIMLAGPVFISIIIFLNEARGFPLNSLKNPNIPSTKVLDFLKQFGYIEEEDTNSGALYTEQGISDIIKTVQKFGAIPETGTLDNATLNLMSSPRCGVPDVNKHKRFKRFIFGSQGWSKATLTYYIANWSPKIGESKVIKTIQTALDTWGKYSRLHFRRSNSPDADIIIAFGSGYHGDRFPFDGPGLILAHAFFPDDDAGFGGDVHFDADEYWTDLRSGESEEGMDFATVALHELGHSLGLSHSAEPNSVMFPYYQQFDPYKELQLGYDDILAMYELYIRRGLRDDSDNNDITSEPYDKTTILPTSSTIDFEPNSGESTITTVPTVVSSTMRIFETSTCFENPTTIINFKGDDESVEIHKNHDTKHHIPTTNSPSLPNICDGHFDAVASLREELFIFKEQYVWRLKDAKNIKPGYPVQLKHMFPHLPTDIKNIDAAYQRPDGMIILFTGHMYWVYDGENLVENSPRPLTDYGLPSILDAVDAVQTWARNSKTYIYWHDRFWRYNESTKTIDEGYPKHLERWRGVPQDLDAATTWKGVTYFFKDKLYWKFDNDWIITTEQSPMPSPQLWLGCPEDEDT